MARRNDEAELAGALVGMLAALAQAGQFAGSGLRTTGRRAGRLGARASGRAWRGTVLSGRRARVALSVLGGAAPPVVVRRRPVEFAGVAAFGAALGAAAAITVARVLTRRRDAWTAADPAPESPAPVLGSDPGPVATDPGPVATDPVAGNGTDGGRAGAVPTPLDPRAPRR
jgi:hypothetical protein